MILSAKRVSEKSESDFFIILIVSFGGFFENEDEDDDENDSVPVNFKTVSKTKPLPEDARTDNSADSTQ